MLISKDFFKKHNIRILLILLALTLTSLAIYNYVTQKNLLEQQMRIDNENIVHSIRSSINRFQDIKSTMSLEKLVKSISLGLEIFEFRYLNPDGVIINSMFEQEIGDKLKRQSFADAMADPATLGNFYEETRDYVKVMAVSYPVYMETELIGIIDMAIDVSEYHYDDPQQRELDLFRRQGDIRNLLRAIAGSIRNSAEIFETTDLHGFLRAYVASTQNILQIAVVNANGRILVSSSLENIGMDAEMPPENRFSHKVVNGKPVFRLIANHISFGEGRERLLLMIDAQPYLIKKRQLLLTAVATSVMSILFSLLIAYSTYRFNIQQARKENIRLEEMVKEHTREIELLSKTDGLTKLWNRGCIEEMLDMEFKRARRYGHELTLMILDLDHFKHINDTYGHLAGDEVLRRTSQRIKNSLRETDLVGRYGGEEIVVILPETHLADAERLAEKLRQKVAAQPVHFEEHAIKATTSVGVSCLRPGNENYQELFQEADAALYSSKANGRNQVTCYEAA